jgi:hypothetical protein
MTDSSDDPEKKIEGLPPNIKKEKMAELKRLVSVLR